MKADLDRIMAERGLDALMVTGGALNNPPMYYLTNGAHVTESTILIKKRGEASVLFASAMERDNAAKSGLTVRTHHEMGYMDIVKAVEGNRLQATLQYRSKLLKDLGITGKVGVYGVVEVSSAFHLYQTLSDMLPDVEIVGEYPDNVFTAAWLTKDPDEIARIQKVGEKTLRVVEKTRLFLASHSHDGERLLKADGSPLTIGDVHARIRAWLYDADLEAPDGFIFAIGYDSALPHSQGEPDRELKLGQTIVYDIFPREAGGGYYYDFTRTWCLGFVPDDVQAIYDDVYAAFQVGMGKLKAGLTGDASQQAVVEFFKSKNHPTSDGNQGYVHSLGHGVGLNIHEPPSLSTHGGQNYTLTPGMALTIEPGLYYPDKGIGVRLEDFVWLNPATGEFEVVGGDYPKTLLIELDDPDDE